MHHSAMGSFNETFLDLFAIFVEAHVTNVICAVTFGLVAHGDHLACVGIEFRMSGKRSTLQLSTKRIQS